MYKIGVIGATGYAGIELVRLLSSHSEIEISILVSHSFAGKDISEIYPSFKNILNVTCDELDINEISQKCDLVFTALPHGVSKTVIPKLIEKNLKVIDLSGDFRYDDEKLYEQWYNEPHSNPQLLKTSVYGLPELHRNKIKNSNLIGNPGCYTTCSILGAAPLLANSICSTENIIIDAKSGVSGAGRGLNLAYHFCECTENMKAYKIAQHRHTSEIEQELGNVAGKDIKLSFTPHLVPMKRGILSTIYLNLKESYTAKELLNIYKEYYKGEFFVRIYEEGTLPETKNVAGSNFVDIGLAVDKRLNRVVVVSALDNLIKGAAGQAIQNMNILLGFEESEGINHPGFYL